jgi:RNA polymerase sigma-70 factor (ECF subfamily)
MSKGHAAWPQFDPGAEALLTFLAARCDTTQDPLVSLRREFLAEGVWLACACERQDRQALEELAGVIGRICSVVARKFSRPLDADELTQRTSQRLLLPGPDGKTRLSTWAGRAPLEDWLKAVVARMAADLSQVAVKEIPLEEAALEVLSTVQSDPEVSLLRQRFQGEFKAAFRKALETLPQRDRNLIRQHLIDRISLDDLAKMQGVHRATVARWLAAARSMVLVETRRHLADAMKISPNDVASLVGQLQSQLDVSLGPLDS